MAMARAKESDSGVLTDQRTKAYDHGQDKVPGGRDDSRGEHLHLAVDPSEALGTDALVLPGRLKVTAVAAVAAREPFALVNVHALGAASQVARAATKWEWVVDSVVRFRATQENGEIMKKEMGLGIGGGGGGSVVGLLLRINVERSNSLSREMGKL